MGPPLTRSRSIRTRVALKAPSVSAVDTNAFKSKVQNVSFDENRSPYLKWTEEDGSFANIFTSLDYEAVESGDSISKPNNTRLLSDSAALVQSVGNIAEGDNATNHSATLLSARTSPQLADSQEEDVLSESRNSSSSFIDDLISDPTWGEDATVSKVSDSLETEVLSSSSESSSSELLEDKEVRCTVTNVTGSCKMGVQLNLYHIAKRARNTQFQPRRRSACTIELRRPKAFGTLFHSGNVRIMGARSVADCERAARKYVRLLRKLGYKQATLLDFRVTNIVAQADIGFRIRLPELASEHYRSCHYEPELSPAVSYEMLEPKLTCIVYASGKIRFAGAKVVGNLEVALEKILAILRQFRKD